MKTALLGLHAETSIHAGAGAALDVIDLPIQREAHNGWPCVYGSAVKGALRAAATARGTPNINIVFGPDDAGYAGALLVGDARLLLLPVRSLSGHFCWVTCPALLRRLQRDAERQGLADRFAFSVPDIPPADGSVPQALGLQATDRLFLEEYRYRVVTHDDLPAIVQAIAALSSVEKFAEDLARQLLLVDDNDFSFLCRHATPVTPHVALDSASKTTKSGMLWYEETLPPETLLYACLAAHDGRKEQEKLAAAEVLGRVIGTLFADRPYLQLGGNETVGMGWCKVKSVSGMEEIKP